MSPPDDPTPATPPSRAAALARLGRLTRKELSEILRDRRTIVTLVLMPLLLYPLLSVAFQQFFLASGLNVAETPAYRLGFQTRAEKDVLLTDLFVGAKVLQNESKERPAPKIDDLLGIELIGVTGELDEALRSDAIDLGVRLPGAKAVDLRHPRDVSLKGQLIYLEGSSRGKEAAAHVERLLAAAHRYYLEGRLHIGDVRPALVLHTTREALHEAGPSSAFSLGPLIPLILILMTITGAVYPAIDLTAGERERGTLEILVAAPVPRLGLLFAKYVTVLTVAVLTALINLATMFGTVTFSGLGPLLFRGSDPTPLLLVELFGLLLLFAAFFSAVLLVLTSFARSFKEAQAYLIPLMLVSLAPGLASLLPGMQLGGLLTVAPLLNIVLLARDLMGGTASLGSAAVVVFSTLLYAAAAVAAAARIFGAEDVLYSEQTAWSDLLRRPAESRSAATVAGALLCLGLMYPTYFVLQGVFGLVLGPAASRNAQLLLIGLMAGLSVLLFGVFPLTAALLRRVRLRPGFLLGPAPWPAYAAALLLGLSLWPFVLEMLALMHAQGWTTLDAAKSEKVLKPLLHLRQSLPLWLTIGSVVIQAVFEELFFRGYLFSALRAAGGARTTILTSAVLFGLFHVLATPLFALDRLLPSTLLGLVLGWVCWQSRSVLPAMLLHACHNTVLEVFSYYQRTASGPEAVPVAWLLLAAVGVAGGVALLAWGRWRRQPLAVATAGMGHG